MFCVLYVHAWIAPIYITSNLHYSPTVDGDKEEVPLRTNGDRDTISSLGGHNGTK